MSTESVFAAPLMKRDDETMYQYCVSFWPTAPLFGVPYRFADMLSVGAKMPFASFKAAAVVVKEEAPAPVAKKAKAAAKKVEKVEAPVVEAAEKVEAAAAEAEPQLAFEAVEPAVEAVETVAETTAEAAVETVAETAEVVAETVSGAPELLYEAAPAVIDDLKLLKGVGPKLEAELNAIGIYTFAQIAGMTEANLHWLDEQISSVRGRPIRDDWAGQAKALAG